MQCVERQRALEPTKATTDAPLLRAAVDLADEAGTANNNTAPCPARMGRLSRPSMAVTLLASTRPALAPAVMAAAQQYIAAFVALLLMSEQEEIRYGQQSLEAWWVEEVHRLNRTGARRDAQWIRGQSPGEVADVTDIDQWFQDGLQYVVAGLLSNR